MESQKEEIIIQKETKFCSNCGAEIDKKAEICPKCGVRLMGNSQGQNLPVGPKNAGLAAVLSFLVVGLGQIYNGQVGKGLLLLVGALISGVLMLVFIGFITWLIIWIYAIYDAYNTANEINAQLEY
ncbi:MAG: zinc-ribbon domain-containing protein [Methanobacteriaceae archaeon]|nr:zinc-ribbon domain-containing protein [Methanobacteriaceae archaeon]MDP2836638.1 zinc-ribbon domain-containing protein [Methanobacteriaceae archaeon]MDP3033566.1 zinc-ribbon domain-containing protein [Methanobacteriaceae archaeon]MDP3485474.1 zinc-ribbon domain-containing protein [Methanobacteriaceae archaeon]MDP3622412.1 zinc-ribbon domain-containing protein [Methanobacteriaceae archaeon]